MATKIQEALDAGIVPADEVHEAETNRDNWMARAIEHEEFVR
jgi:hypothetical protein